MFGGPCEQIRVIQEEWGKGGGGGGREKEREGEGGREGGSGREREGGMEGGRRAGGRERLSGSGRAQIRAIQEHLPPPAARQTLMFTATWPRYVRLHRVP